MRSVGLNVEDRKTQKASDVSSADKEILLVNFPSAQTTRKFLPSQEKKRRRMLNKMFVMNFHRNFCLAVPWTMTTSGRLSEPISISESDMPYGGGADTK